MKVFKQAEDLPIKMWLEDIESSAMTQAINMSRLPFAFHHIALMPDCHTGFGCPIGSVLATEKVIVPACVGVDVGCGVHAVQTDIPVERLQGRTKELEEICRVIYNHVPVGMMHRINAVPEGSLPVIDTLSDDSVVFDQFEAARFQLGTLGGGNHFIEIQRGSDGFIWYMIHSGSRNVGFKVANHYDHIAKELNERWFSSVPKEWQLAFLPIEVQEATDYLLDMRWCLDFAKLNRELIAFHVNIALDRTCGKFNETHYDVHHNYVNIENHFGKNVYVHRKGATSAYDGELGIIPGSQGTSSYIVRGLGNPESFKSCSHGAGRKMSRTDARKNLSVEAESKILDEKGIIHSIKEVENLDEAPSAYKDINVVMENQKDLVTIQTELNPLAVMKG